VVTPGVVAAVGHFRNGLLLAPATGEMVADLVLGRAPRVDPAPFAPGAAQPPDSSPA
jgi:glycine oxidase